MSDILNGRISTFVTIFSRKRYVAIAAVGAAAFYYIFYYLVTTDNFGAFLLFIPIYLIYALVVSSGILFAISVFAVANSAASRRLGIEGGIIGVLLPSVGGVVAGCACAFPLLASILLFIGVNTFEAAGVVSLVGGYQLWIDIAMILVNIAMIYYYLGRLRLHPRRRRR